MQKLSIATAFFLSFCTLSLSAADDDHWDPQFGGPGADNLITSIFTSGSDVYITGIFNTAGESKCTALAKWDGTNWAGFGSGFYASNIFPVTYAVATRGSDLYVGGVYFTNVSGVQARGLAKWNGSTWSEVGGGINGLVSSLLWVGNDLYVAGLFTQMGSSVTASNIARWDGTNWFPLSEGIYGATNGFPSPLVWKLALDANGHVIVVGNFRYAGAVEVNNVARWDGSQWHAMGNGVFNGGPGLSLYDVAVKESNVYVAGAFKSASGVNATNIARWDGSQWHAMGGGPTGTNAALAIVGSTLYTAGNFTNIGGVAARFVARWNGSAWEALAPGPAGEISTRVSCLGVAGESLYAGGDFIRAGNAGVLGIAQWDGNQWSALNGAKTKGLFQGAREIAASGPDVYVGGAHSVAGGVRVNRIGHWNGTAWDDMGGGLLGGSGVNSIAVNAGLVYVGGTFTNAGGVTVRNIAYWDGGAWHAMGSGLNSNVNALVFYAGELYAGGSFTRRGDNTGSFFSIAKWDGLDWVVVPGISVGFANNVINALATDGTYLYAGGDFLMGWPDGGGAEDIARFDGADWSSLGLELGASVLALDSLGGELYAGGSFTNSSIQHVRRIARWDGANWTQVGDGFGSGSVSALGVIGSTLYAGGSFTNSGATVLNRVAKWNGTQWLPLGSGVRRITAGSASVLGMAVSGDDVYFVGNFTEAGPHQSAYFARWNETISFVPPIIRLLNAGLDALGQFRFDISGLSSGTFTVDASTNLTDWSSIFSDSAPNTNFTDVDSPTIPSRNYRVRTP